MAWIGSSGWFSKRERAFFLQFQSKKILDLEKKILPFLSSPAAPRRSVLVRAVEPPKADAKPGLELAKSGNSFAAVKDIEAIQEILPHR